MGAKLFLLFLFAGWQAHGAQDWRQSAQAVFSKEIASVGASESSFGLWVNHNGQVAELNGSSQFVPASLSKIPTALTFLQHHSVGDKFHTWIYKTGSIEDGVLKGDLYLKGGGDPSFVTETMWTMVNQLKRSDIKKVAGKVYVDESYFDNDYYSEGRQQRRVDRAYDAPVSGLSFNWNSISIYVRPGEKLGQKARVYTDPELPIIEIQNETQTAAISKHQLRVDRYIEGEKVIIKVTGKVAKGKDEKAFYKSIANSAIWTGHVFVKQLNQVGIEYSGGVTKAVVPKNADMLVEQESWSVPRIMAALSKFSNNFVAEMLTKHLGKTKDIPASIDDGLSKISQYLKSNGWKDNEFTFVNPSGFTRENSIRPDHLGELLMKARNDFSLAPEFMSSLPISGTDGTLKSRMKDAMKGKVRAKTGYLSGVVALGGYMEARDGGKPITFVFIYNGPSKNDWKVRAMFNRMLWRLYQKS